ncbi:hypothetical protein KC19_10G034700 [Ceratodon purpureus]|uniref:Cupin type-2 domain-containing protein n=1 Tax=Ceratodon purpureus TaxID=3225 RepID=A0A8T0GIW5_CERPU|nr:hypothetical protein KC19_10G034700 [Ceratodon purpureus]
MSVAMAMATRKHLLLLLLTFSAVVASASSICEDVLASSTCGGFAAATDTSDMYSKVTDPTLSASHLQDLPGFTRSVYERDHALITPESQVFSPLPGWLNTLAAYMITPAMGAHFTMYLATMAGNSSSAEPPSGIERFVFIVKGETTLTADLPQGTATLKVDEFAYIPPGSKHTFSTSHSATLVVFERRYSKGGDGAPKLFTGRTNQQPNLETPGEVFDLRKLLPATPTYDFNIHVMDFQPGEYLNVKEVHYNQHGLLLLEGRGIYRLADKWYPVQAGDVIWMAPFVPQWYAALGKTRSRYILYKDTARDPLLHPY